MPDYYHKLPVCGYRPHVPHAGSCDGEGTLVACGSITIPGHPHFGEALCRHVDPNDVGNGEEPEEPQDPESDTNEENGPQDGPLPNCEGQECTVTFHEIVEASASEFLGTGGRWYDMPEEGDEYYNFAFYPGMREAFAARIERLKRAYAPAATDCPNGCICAPSTDPEDRFVTEIEITVEAAYPFPDGSSTARIRGTYVFRSTDVKGRCRPAPPGSKPVYQLPQERGKSVRLPPEFEKYLPDTGGKQTPRKGKPKD